MGNVVERNHFIFHFVIYHFVIYHSGLPKAIRIAYVLLAVVGAPSPLCGTPKCLLESTY